MKKTFKFKDTEVTVLARCPRDITGKVVYTVHHAPNDWSSPHTIAIGYGLVNVWGYLLADKEFLKRSGENSVVFPRDLREILKEIGDKDDEV